MTVGRHLRAGPGRCGWWRIREENDVFEVQVRRDYDFSPGVWYHVVAEFEYKHHAEAFLKLLVDGDIDDGIPEE